MKIIKIMLILVLLVLPLLESAYSTTRGTVYPDPGTAIERIDALALAEYEKEKLGSLTIGVISGSQLVWGKSYGYADMGTKKPATNETIYRVGSITMQFTALMLLQLEQEGKVHLSDPVEKYFPEVNRIPSRFSSAPPLTLIQLATHTSGLASEPDDLSIYGKGEVADWEKTLIAALPHTKYIYEPGTRVAYSNVGYAILGAALSRAASQPYIEYMQRRIFSPLGMSSTSFQISSQTAARLSKGYLFEDGKVDESVPEREHQGRGYKVPNGGIYTTLPDLARFVAFELGYGPPGVLKKEFLDDNFRRLTVLADERQFYVASGYGIGFRFRVHGNGLIWGFAGGTPGYEARADFDRTARIGVIVLRNVGGRTVHVATTQLVGEAIDIVAAKVP